MVVKQTVDKPTQNSHLFMLRLWPEDLGDGQTDWRGSIQHVNSGELRYFRDWLTLQEFVEVLLQSTLQARPRVESDESVAH